MLNMPHRESSGRVTWCSQELRTSHFGHFSWKMLSKAPAAGALVLLMLLAEKSHFLLKALKVLWL